MKKRFSVALFTIATLFMFSHTAFANSCTYEVGVKSNVGRHVEVTSVLYKYVDDPFGLWYAITTRRQNLDSSSDFYDSGLNTNISLLCDSQNFAITVVYMCTGVDGQTREYGKQTATFSGSHTNKIYTIINDCDAALLYKEDSWPGPASTTYIYGYIYGTNSNANTKCLQAQTDSFANGVDVHLWDKCNNGGPQKNRQWKFELATGYIRNIDDPSFCLHKATDGFTVGDNIHMWHCDEGPEQNKQWEYNVNGQNLIRSLANNNFCIFRGGANVGDAIHLWSCDPYNNTDQNGRWNITWGGGG